MVTRLPNLLDFERGDQAGTSHYQYRAIRSGEVTCSRIIALPDT